MARTTVLRRLVCIPAMAALLAVLGGAVPAGGQPPGGPARGLIWEVERDGQVGWLVGSLHVLTAEHYPLPDTIEGAFERASTLVEEVDTDALGSPQVMALLVTRGFYAGGETLDRELPAPIWAMVTGRASRLGLPIDTLRRMRPWMAGLTLVGLELERAGFQSEHGIDNYFRRKAGQENKTFQALETAEQQIEYLAGFPPEVQHELLRSSLEDADRQLREVEALVRAWQAGDAPGLERLLLEAFQQAPEVYQTLIVDRNRRWMPPVEACLARGGCFVVVGAGHMVGADGLVRMLQQRGYRVEQR